MAYYRNNYRNNVGYRNSGGYVNNYRSRSLPKAKSGFKQTINPDVYSGFRVVNGVLYSYMLTPPVELKTDAKLYYTNKQGLERHLYRVKVTNTVTGESHWSIAYYYPEQKHFVSKPLGLVFKLKVNRKESVGQGGIFRLVNNK